MTDDDRRNIEAVKRMYRGEVAENATIASDIVWHVPGHNPVSGDYRGYQEYTELMPSRMAPLTRWDFEVGRCHGQRQLCGRHVSAAGRAQRPDRESQRRTYHAPE